MKFIGSFIVLTLIASLYNIPGGDAALRIQWRPLRLTNTTNSGRAKSYDDKSSQRILKAAALKQTDPEDMQQTCADNPTRESDMIRWIMCTMMNVFSGNDGSGGNNGNDGSGGYSGNDGSSGNSGNDGSDGNNGNDGSGGYSGNDGSGDNSGNDGSGGDSGNDGSGGNSGNDGSGGNSSNDGYVDSDTTTTTIATTTNTLTNTTVTELTSYTSENPTA